MKDLPSGSGGINWKARSRPRKQQGTGWEGKGLLGTGTGTAAGDRLSDTSGWVEDRIERTLKSRKVELVTKEKTN